ncbi:MAG: endo-1,4-beta-xylanase [Planctomycetota bacterium]|nr:MAG: endo-1,4-beta-xylanase [Planctomycetota bacterium]
MLRFTLNSNGQEAEELTLDGAYAVGSEGVPLRAELIFSESELVCTKRTEGPAGVALLWPVKDFGSVILETSRLMDREDPYVMALELVRGRLMRINQKREDWGLFDCEGVEEITDEIDQARALFIEAIKADEPERKTELSDKALKIALIAGEKLSHFHADIFLTRRKQTHAFTKRTIGCCIDVKNTSDEYRKMLLETMDFAYLPMPWSAVEPKQQEYDWRIFDNWIEWLIQNRIPVKVGALISFHESHIPPWLGMYETDFEMVRNLIFDHVRRIVERYGQYVYQWNVISGVHAENTFDFTFDQLMELTRVTVSLVKQLAPKAQSIIDLTMPWGEYFARNQRTIPPMLYMDMVVQSGVGFDGIGVQLIFGAPSDGMYVRDMFQISEKLDRLGNFGKPVHITAVQVPSKPLGNGSAASGGSWWRPWSEEIQARWIKEFCAIALSKPFVESIAWRDLNDRSEPSALPCGGLLRDDLKPKPAYKVLMDIRKELLASIRKPPANKPA